MLHFCGRLVSTQLQHLNLCLHKLALLNLLCQLHVGTLLRVLLHALQCALQPAQLLLLRGKCSFALRGIALLLLKALFPPLQILLVLLMQLQQLRLALLMLLEQLLLQSLCLVQVPRLCLLQVTQQHPDLLLVVLLRRFELLPCLLLLLQQRSLQPDDVLRLLLRLSLQQLHLCLLLSQCLLQLLLVHVGLHLRLLLCAQPPNLWRSWA